MRRHNEQGDEGTVGVLLSGQQVLERIYPPERRPPTTDVLMKLVKRGVKSASGRQVRLRVVIGPFGRMYRPADVDAFLAELTQAWEQRNGISQGEVVVKTTRRQADRVLRQVARERELLTGRVIRCAPGEIGTYPRDEEGRSRTLDVTG